MLISHGMQMPPYLRRQLIAYIGNKRSLLSFLRDIFRRLAAEHPVHVFLDPFAGSGAVSRLARTMGYRVLANDWEFYAKVINACHLAVEARELDGLFRGRIDAVLEELNGLEAPRSEDAYVSRYYAPHRTADADYRTERLFYTAENGGRIDAIRSRIEEWYPGFDLSGAAYREKMILLASLLYQCATHTNTSGVFKAYHRGFGGFGADALRRIMAEIRLQRPELIDAKARAEIFQMDAADFAARHSGDLCYLDPPYTTHQYGSNYHMLNTVALWDRPPVSNVLGEDGRLREKAAIRRDWVSTRSDFCYRDTAPGAFRRLLDAIDARCIVLSYNTEGIVAFEELCDLLNRHGRLRLFCSDYVKYRGGKQSLFRDNHNLELLLVVERGAPRNAEWKSEVRRLLLERKVDLAFKQSYVPLRVRERFDTADSSAIVAGGMRFPMPDLYRFSPPPVDAGGGSRGLPDRWSEREIEDFLERLRGCLCSDKREEIDVLIELVANGDDPSERRRLIRRMLRLLRKFAFKKYRREFVETLDRLKELVRTKPGIYDGMIVPLELIERLADRRFYG